MGPENPIEQVSQNPDQKEWQGQKWEYLVLTINQDQIQGVVGAMREKGLFKRPEVIDPTVKYYEEKLQSLKKDISVHTISEFLNILGSDGWELVASAPRYTGIGDGPPFLFLKRPLL